MNLQLRFITADDNLQEICDQMQPGSWARDNEMTSYQADTLKEFLKNPMNILLLAYDQEHIAGAALCYELPHPAGENSLYVHELDTHPGYRRRGVATAIMRKLHEIARQRQLGELWLGTETDNAAANRFYKSLQPAEIEPSVIYTYKVK